MLIVRPFFTPLNGQHIFRSWPGKIILGELCWEAVMHVIAILGTHRNCCSREVIAYVIGYIGAVIPVIPVIHYASLLTYSACNREGYLNPILYENVQVKFQTALHSKNSAILVKGREIVYS